MTQDSTGSGTFESSAADGESETAGASWKNDAIDHSLASLRAEIASEKKDAGEAKQKALERGESLIDDIEDALKKHID